jgi:ribonuclease BN (tRNA processing enzyme)
VRYGGHTSCVAVAHDDQPPNLILDAGTGIRRVTELLGGAAFRGAILLGHLHWDHTHGLPFFLSGDHPDSEVDVYLPAQGEDPLEILARGFGPPHFPVRPDELRGTWRFHALEEGEHRIAGFDVLAREIPHKGGRAFGYRIGDGRSTLTYMSDHGPIELGPGPAGEGELHEAALELCHETDLLLHDAQHTSEEFPTRSHFGHSTIAYGVALAEKAGARRLALYHHDPARTDDALDAIVAELDDAPVAVGAAREGQVIDL